MEDFLLVLVLWIDLSQAACRSLRPLDELELDSSVSVGELERSSSLDTDIDIGARADVCWAPTWCSNRHHLFWFKLKLLASATWPATKFGEREKKERRNKKAKWTAWVYCGFRRETP